MYTSLNKRPRATTFTAPSASVAPNAVPPGTMVLSAMRSTSTLSMPLLNTNVRARTVHVASALTALLL